MSAVASKYEYFKDSKKFALELFPKRQRIGNLCLEVLCKKRTLHGDILRAARCVAPAINISKRLVNSARHLGKCRVVTDGPVACPQFGGPSPRLRLRQADVALAPRMALLWMMTPAEDTRPALNEDSAAWLHLVHDDRICPGNNKHSTISVHVPRTTKTIQTENFNGGISNRHNVNVKWSLID